MVYAMFQPVASSSDKTIFVQSVAGETVSGYLYVAETGC